MMILLSWFAWSQTASKSHISKTSLGPVGADWRTGPLSGFCIHLQEEVVPENPETLYFGSLWSGSFLFLFLILFIFRERGGKEKERERNIDWLPVTYPQMGTWPAAQACDLGQNWTSDLLVGRPTLSPLSHTSRGWSGSFWRMKLTPIPSNKWRH